MKQPRTLEGRRWLDREDASAYLGISPTTFDRELRDLLPASHITSRAVYDRQDIDRILESRKRKEFTL